MSTVGVSGGWGWVSASYSHLVILGKEASLSYTCIIWNLGTNCWLGNKELECCSLAFQMALNRHTSHQFTAHLQSSFPSVHLGWDLWGSSWTLEWAESVSATHPMCVSSNYLHVTSQGTELQRDNITILDSYITSGEEAKQGARVPGSLLNS